MRSYRDVIDLWPSREALASEIGAEPAAVSKWWQRDSIPASWWLALSSTQIARANAVTVEYLAAIAASARETAG